MLFTTLILIAGCSSSKQEKSTDPPAARDSTNHSYPNLTGLTPPGDNQQVQSAKVYIDSVKRIEGDGKPVLLISGNFPNGCTRLRNAAHTISEGTPSVTLTAWQPADKMCTQALVPFSFIYRQVPPEPLSDAGSVTVNDTQYELNSP